MGGPGAVCPPPLGPLTCSQGFNYTHTEASDLLPPPTARTNTEQVFNKY